MDTVDTDGNHPRLQALDLQAIGALARLRIAELQSQQACARNVIADLEQQLCDAEARIANLETALITSRRIGAAIGILMVRRKLAEADAFQVLCTMSSRRHRKLRDVAEDLVRTTTRHGDERQ